MEGKAVTDAAVADRAYNNASSFYGTGGAVQRGIQAATGALTVLAGGGDLAGALAAASAPELANIIGHRSGLNKDDALIAHALLGGVVASLQGKSAAAGAAGALTGELAARAIKDQLFPGKEISDLSESDKQYISNLATIASGLAGNIVSGNSSGTTAGAQAGKNAVENNSLGRNLCNEEPWACRDNPLIEGGAGPRGAYNPTGRNGNPMNAKGSNTPAVIGERTYSAHAVDRMQGRGVPPSAVENTIKTGATYPTNAGTTGYYDATNNLRVIVNSKTGDVVTVIPGAPTK
ncbi:VENN motif pre-toxin domain-containing protein [Lelliottia wanjuensis]|uniref:VENN motif pre-toxin domain-containing protein n=1 Tax=Lelliottia wanjuensis TaxID=3050585 RepID=UPI0036F2BAA0